jgi:predicted O-linked N-acetylglucosamine transferase (SPINDLY family)
VNQNNIQTAVEYYQAGNFRQAELTCKDALKESPDNHELLDLLGIIYFESGRYDLAVEYWGKLIQHNQSNEYAYYNLGLACQGKNQFDDAIHCYQKALQINPGFENAYYNLGLACQRKKQPDNAIHYYQKALQLNPASADVYNNLGLIFHEKKQFDNAIAHYSKALELNPDAPNVYNNLGNTLQGKGQYDKAVECFRIALQLNPVSAETSYNLGNTLNTLGRNSEAAAAYENAISINPGHILSRWGHTMTTLPVVYADGGGIMSSRRRYAEELGKLAEILRLITPGNIHEAAEAVGCHQPFYLACQGMNDRELQGIYGKMASRVMGLRYPMYAERPAMPSRVAGEPLRVGIVSGHFHYHSIWKIPLRGWLEDFDRERFRLYGYSTGGHKDQVTEKARQRCARFVEDVFSFEELCGIISNDRLHVLLYPEIGMDPISLRLAALRLAPVQCTTLGHPDTSGLPTIDYYLSSELMEPPDGEEHYTEKLIRLPNLSFSYAPPEIIPATAGRETFGIRTNAVVYLCSHALFTHLPQYDWIYTRIAREVNNCQFVFISHPGTYVTEQFVSRLFEEFRKANLNPEHCLIFLKELSPCQYQALNRISDVFLDTMGWSANNSTFEAVAHGLPVITLPGKLMRQRHCAGILSMMGLKETVAESVDSYVSLAVRLGLNPSIRYQISEQYKERKHLLYNDQTCIAALEKFLETATGEIKDNPANSL